MRPASSCGRAPLSARQRSLYLERAIDVSQHHVGAGARHVDAIVEPPQQGIGVHLDVGLAAPVAGGDEVFPVAPEIAIRVAHQPDVRGLAHEHALLEDLHRQRLDQAVGEHRAPVHGAIAVRVLEHDDAADGLVLAGRLDIAHVAGQLDGPESSSRIPVDRDRILDERLARHQFEAVAGRHGERSERLRRREDGSPRRDRLHGRRPLPSRSRLLHATQCDNACGEHQNDGANARADPAESNPVHFPTIAAIRRVSIECSGRRALPLTNRRIKPCLPNPEPRAPSPSNDKPADYCHTGGKAKEKCHRA